jgi:hypothetical protein
MRRLPSILGNTGAILTLVCAVLTPFVLYDVLQKGVAAIGLRVDPEYSGGETSHVVRRNGYRIVVNRPVRRRSPWQRIEPFVQLTWTPASGLPAHVSDAVDLDGDGSLDVEVSFDAPRAGQTALSVDATPVTDLVMPLYRCSTHSFSALIAPVKEGIVVRLPLAREWNPRGQPAP